RCSTVRTAASRWTANRCSRCNITRKPRPARKTATTCSNASPRRWRRRKRTRLSQLGRHRLVNETPSTVSMPHGKFARTVGPHMRSLFFAFLFVALNALSISPANSEPNSDDELARDLIHSDLPIFRGEPDQMWPQPFYTQDSFGCVTRVAFGDWELRPR